MMGSHRKPFAGVALVSAALLAAGCGSGRDTAAFMPDGAPAAESAEPAPREIPQVVVAAPKQALVDERAAAAAAAERRKAARRRLREERERAQRERAAAREDQPSAAPVAARRKLPATDTDTATPEPQVSEPDPPIATSDTGQDLIAERDRRSDAEARAAVLRFHELVDRRDVRSCDLLTRRLLVSTYGTEDPLGRCRAAVSSLADPVAVTIAESRTHGRASSVAVVTRVGDQEYPQTMHLVLVDGTWLVDRVERRSTG